MGLPLTRPATISPTTKWANAGRSQSRQGFTWDALGRRIAHVNDALGITTRYFFDGVNELAEYADNGTGNGLRSRYYVHGVSYVDERLMMYDDETDRPYYYVTDRMHNVRVIVDRAGAIRERYAYDPYGRPLIRELCGRGDMNDDTRMTTTPDDSRFEDAEDDTIWDPRADLDDDGDVDGADETAYHNKKPTWSSVMSAPTVSQAFSDFDNPYAFQGVPHFALDTSANATSEQLNLALNHHRARFVDVQVGRWTTRDPLHYAKRLMIVTTPRNREETSDEYSQIFIRPLMISGQLRAALEPFSHLANRPTSNMDPTGLAASLCPIPCYKTGGTSSCTATRTKCILPPAIFNCGEYWEELHQQVDAALTCTITCSSHCIAQRQNGSWAGCPCNVSSETTVTDHLDETGGCAVDIDDITTVGHFCLLSKKLTHHCVCPCDD
jgi:YD repeat-containing protein